MPTTAYAVLGLLSFGTERSGYELRQVALDSLRFFYWTPAQSQIYKELRRLEELGYVRGRAVAQRDRPDKVAYGITDEGLAECRRWLATAPVAPPVFKFDAALRLFFGHLSEPERLAEVVDEHRRYLADLLADLDRVRAALGDEPTSAYPRVLARWGSELYANELATLAQVREAVAGDAAAPEEAVVAPPGRRLG